MRRYIAAYGISHDSFANFSIVAHANANLNPNAVFHKPIDFEAYANSRVVIDPLRLYDVSPICNGSAALVLAAGDTAKRLCRNRPAIRIAASAAATAPVALSRRADALHLTAVASATEAVLKNAGVSRREIDLMELHDAYTIMTALCLESAGFAAPGTATSLAIENRITRSGDLPLATFGGLKARGHPVGATGVYQLAEAYLQLSGRAGPNQVADAAIAMVQNIGGTGSTVVNHILRRID
jgi:acetyl-CoA C-acetyltransferase